MFRKSLCIICVLISLSLLAISAESIISYNLHDKLAPSECTANPQNITILESRAGTGVSLPSKDIYAKSACLMDQASGRILYNKEADTPLPMASTTKIMTCILALENAASDSIVKASKYAAGMPDVQLNMTEGEEFRLSDLLYSLMLESHNDTAAAIAEHIGSSVKEFAGMMNKKASELGCSDTCFVTPNGLDSENHHSTAADLCLIASYAVKNPEFIKIIQTPSHSFSNMAGTKQYTVNNHDAFLKMYNGAIGIKTGFTGKAGYCFVGAATRNDMTLISAVLASGWPPHKTYKWNDTCKLMDYGFDNYKTTTLLNGKISLNPLPIKDSRNICNSTSKQVSLSLSATYSMPVCEGDSSSLILELPECLTAPVGNNETIGYARLVVNDKVVNKYPITAAEDIPEYTLLNYFSIVIDTFMLKM